MTEPTQEAFITCPDCGARTAASMPEDACQFFWECPSCTTIVRPKAGDCCVFCSYADVACPPVQRAADTSGGASAPCCS
jgi:hypothetical protein